MKKSMLVMVLSAFCMMAMLWACGDDNGNDKRLVGNWSGSLLMLGKNLDMSLKITSDEFDLSGYDGTTLTYGSKGEYETEDDTKMTMYEKDVYSALSQSWSVNETPAKKNGTYTFGDSDDELTTVIKDMSGDITIEWTRD